jgi:hypothetical protein
LSCARSGRVRDARLTGRAQRDPRVAAQAAVPAQAVRLAGEQAIFVAQPGGIGAEQLVAVQAAADQLMQPISSYRSFGR